MDTTSEAGPTITVDPANLVPADEETDIQRIRARAEEQAAADMALLVKLQERDGAQPEQEPINVVTPERMPMNRAERRQQVALYARVLADSERQAPVVNPTIIPKSKRRRRRA